MLINDWIGQRYEVVNHTSLLSATIRIDKSIKARTSLPLLDWPPHSNLASQLVLVSNTLSSQSARYHLPRIQRTDSKRTDSKEKATSCASPVFVNRNIVPDVGASAAVSSKLTSTHTHYG